MLQCVLQVGVIGISFKTAGLPLREAFARAAEVFADERAYFFPNPVICLSTCERVEFYFSAPDLAEAQIHLLTWLKKTIAEPFEHQPYTYFGLDAFVHLCRVTSGLDSAVVGESDIQRQVKVAYARAPERLPSCLHYVFQKALRVSKGVRSQTACTANLYSAVWKILGEHSVNIFQSPILLVGYSEWNRGLLSFLQHKGVQNISLITQSPDQIHLPIPVYGREELARWTAYDLIFCATTATDYLICGASHRKHLIFDLGVPRNVDPAVGLQEGIFLYNIEQIDQQLEPSLSSPSEEQVREHALRLARLYRAKILRGQGSEGRGSRLEYFPSR